MPPRKKPWIAAPMLAADRIGDLPDHILHHVLSFLPAQAAVQTCMLARRWRHLWRSTTGLRIVSHDYEEAFNVEDLRVFVDHLLILRERTELDTVEIKFEEFHNDDEPYLKLWTRFAVMCKVRALTLHIHDSYLYLDDLRLVSRHLRALDLRGVALEKALIDFSSCPALEVLKMNKCYICANNVSSRSMKHLTITRCRSELDTRISVSTPGLVSLRLERFSGQTPFLENMALLETARVITCDHNDRCLDFDSVDFCGANNNWVANKDHYSSDCELLGGISSAKHIMLLSESKKIVITRDLKRCPTFSKLKTLLLNEYWCKAPGFNPLTCILKKTPVLEKLTLQLFPTGPKHKVEMRGSYSPMEGSSAISEHLNIVEVKCNVVNGRILKVLKFLTALNIRKKLPNQAAKKKLLNYVARTVCRDTKLS